MRLAWVKSCMTLPLRLLRSFLLRSASAQWPIKLTLVTNTYFQQLTTFLSAINNFLFSSNPRSFQQLTTFFSAINNLLFSTNSRSFQQLTTFFSVLTHVLFSFRFSSFSSFCLRSVAQACILEISNFCRILFYDIVGYFSILWHLFCYLFCWIALCLYFFVICCVFYVPFALFWAFLLLFAPARALRLPCSLAV